MAFTHDLRCIHTARERDPDRAQWESVLLSVPVQYEHLRIILHKTIFICLSIGLGVG